MFKKSCWWHDWHVMRQLRDSKDPMLKPYNQKVAILLTFLLPVWTILARLHYIYYPKAWDERSGDSLLIILGTVLMTFSNVVATVIIFNETPLRLTDKMCSKCQRLKLSLTQAEETYEDKQLKDNIYREKTQKLKEQYNTLMNVRKRNV